MHIWYNTMSIPCTRHNLKYKCEFSTYLPVIFTSDSFVSMFWISFKMTSIPSITFPNTTCFPSSHFVGTVVIKNCAPFVFGPEFAIDSNPASVCFILKFSSSNFAPYTDFPPVLKLLFIFALIQLYPSPFS